MTPLEFFNRNVFFTTRKFAFELGISIEVASRKLHRDSSENSMTQVTRGIWCQMHHPFYSPYGAVPFLLGNEQGYISFLTVLHRHGILSQIPQSIQVATTGHGRRLKTTIGNFEFFQLQPNMMRVGVDIFDGKVTYNIASKEKALVDVLYISARRGNRFARLPELEWDEISSKKIKKILNTFGPRARVIVENKLEMYELLRKN